jgi:alkaline phosphatase D
MPSWAARVRQWCYHGASDWRNLRDPKQKGGQAIGLAIVVMHDRIRLYDRALQRLSRRELLNVAWRLGAASVLYPLSSARLFGQPIFRDYPFTLGVASGDPWPESVVLWTRLAPEPLEGGGMPAANIEVAWEVGAEFNMRTIVRKGTSIARPELGHSVHVEVDGLAPGREYWYRFRVGNEVSQIGRAVTAPPADAAVERLRFGVCGCSHYETGFFTAFRRLADERFDFVFHTGDYIYEGRGNRARNPALVRNHHGQEIYTVVDYRNRYAQYKSDPDLLAAHLSSPFIVSWDDHEVDNDYAGEIDENDTPVEVFLLRRAAAYQAYFEHMPLRKSSMPTGPTLQLYRRLRFGNLIDLSVLDTRQYRSDQACGHGGATNCAAAADGARSILGASQEKWLFEQLATVRARWTVLGQQVPMFARDNGADAPPQSRFSMDKWDGYTASRQRVIARLKETKAPNPIALSGDVHVHYGADLKLDFGDARSETIGVEFTNSSITSGGDGTEVSPAWERVRQNNPHIKFHSNRRGYVACTATQQTMRAEFKVVDRVTIENQPIHTAGALVVEAGRAGGVTD